MIMVEYNSNHPDSRPTSVHGSSRYQPHISSPHLGHLEHRPSPHSTPSPTFSYAQPPLQNRQNITSYPSPGSYPSPSMSSYSYPQQPGSARDSPTYSAASLPGVGSSNFSLPPIRLAPPPTSSPVPQTLQVGSPLPAPSPSLPGMQGYYPMPGGPPHLANSPHQPNLRYPLPSVMQPSERIMSGGRHKKEIKRRTKTGCLTCRKRRIKCDEAHPTCKNCAKSKRECLGYDPIFKQAPQGPPPIQPAPVNTPPSLAPANYGVSPGPALPMPHHGHQMSMTMAMPMPPMPPMSHHHMPTSAPMPYMTSGHALSTNGSSPRSQYEFDPYSAIDPALESATLPPPNLSPMLGERMTLHSDSNGFRDLKRTYDRGSPFPGSVSDTPRTSGTPIPRSSTPGASGYPNFRDDLSTGNPAKRIKIDDLIAGSAPPPPTPPPSENAYLPGNEGVKALYSNKYAPALDQLFETGWFSDECISIMSLNLDLVNFLGTVFDRLNSGEAPASAETSLDHLPPGKAALILYTVMDLLYGLGRKSDGPLIGPQSSRAENISETLDRVRIIETLVMNKRLEDEDDSTNMSLADFNPEEESPDVRSTKFWGAIKMFLRLSDPGSPAARDILKACHPYLESGLDNREIIYSIATIRHLQAAFKDSREDTYPDPEERRRRGVNLDDAKSFIEGMARTPSGEITCVFRRICSRALALFQRQEASQHKLL
ncbi:hypothetical protein TWF569_011742 [Orbilia oligospora]|uniref:Zn(2)-C6 fungal-type domain-containing protein n=1 Tax=Orbilia oligospora TaxID=2813651 RepID=A0A7C8J4H2_ORBOL|nr:hypothetical protein TWF102_004476 [Orbilia oligospora]KAF3078468.1 hypothetical protein TWF706_004338 [Orbilia oligospora]KAF3086557.1 hypothetical protein TWF103_001768 [Orbilia oligospora]KAF3119912.1 hypothetical protein TWF703_002976 [Orbilia oligospora]KAF3120406.1 hypothetical protein TWF594_003903 [Orbilia oligospora]